jgi:hypothetical protein
MFESSSSVDEIQALVHCPELIWSVKLAPFVSLLLASVSDRILWLPTGFLS